MYDLYDLWDYIFLKLLGFLPHIDVTRWFLSIPDPYSTSDSL